MKSTKPTDVTQAENGFGRIPENLFGPLCQLTHLARSVFLLLCIKANRYRERKGKQIGEVPNSVNDIAMWLNTSRGSVRRALKSLDAKGLIDYWRGGIRVRHYMDHGDPHVDHGDPFEMDHGDPALDHGDPLGDHGDPGGGSPRSTQSPQPQPSIDSYEPPIGSEEVSEEEVKRGARKARKKPARKSAPPHPLSGLVSWDKEKREVRIEQNGYGLLIGKLATLAKHEGLAHRLSDAEWQEGWGRLNGHLMGNPFKTGPKTLPAIVLNWFETDLRRKNNHPQRGKPLAQRIDDKTKELMNGEQRSRTEISSIVGGLLESGSFRRNR